MPMLFIKSAISSPTLMQSVVLPPKILRCLSARLTSTACLRDSLTQSATPSPPFCASGRTPHRSAIISSRVIGLSNLSRSLILSNTNCRSSSVTPTSGSSTWVSVVPTEVLLPMGITKNKRPSLAKKAKIRRSSLTRSTIR